MKVKKTNIIGLFVIEIDDFKDFRGSFMKIYSKKEFHKNGLLNSYKDLNFSNSISKGTFRGLHYQKDPDNETKLIKCVSGKICDYAIDFRKESSTYRNIHKINLSGNDNKVILIPHGIAHGYQALEDNSSLIYLSSGYYNSDSEVVISPVSPELNLNLDFKPILSDKDKKSTFDL